MQPCAPLHADAGLHAAAALSADAVNRAHYIECQARQRGLIDTVRGWIDAGIIGSRP